MLVIANRPNIKLLLDKLPMGLRSGSGVTIPYFLATGVVDLNGVWLDYMPFPAPYFLSEGVVDRNGVWDDGGIV